MAEGSLQTFHPRYGDNVCVSENLSRASWTCQHSGGWVYCESPLGAGETVHVTAEGSGHYDVGYITRDPLTITDADRKTPSFKQLNEVKIHKRDCIIPVSFNNICTEVSSVYNNATFRRSTDQADKIWITVYIKFGDINTSLMKGNAKLKFSAKHGSNIELKESNHRAEARKKNPASVCFLKEPLRSGQEYRLRCTAIKDGGRLPSRYHVTVGVSTVKPDQLFVDFRHIFSAVRPNVNTNPPITIVETFERDVCEGISTIKLVNGNVLYYEKAGKRQSQVVTDGVAGNVWLMLDLYRVAIDILDDERTYEVVDGAGYDVPDTIYTRPRPETGPDDRQQEPTTSQLMEYFDRSRSLENNQQWFQSTLQRLERPGVTNEPSQPISPTDDAAPEYTVSLLTERISRMELMMQQLLERTPHPDIPTPVPVAGNANHEPANFMRQISSRLENVEQSLNTLIDQRLATEQRMTGNEEDQICTFRFVDVIQNMEPVPILDHLFQDGHINNEERDNMTKLNDDRTQDANRKLVTCMMNKKVTRRVLEPILKKTLQAHLIPMLFKS